MIDQAIADLIRYALDTGLIAQEEKVRAVNRLLPAMGLDGREEFIIYAASAGNRRRVGAPRRTPKGLQTDM